ncbi:acyltransferase [Clostridium sp. NSJ-6]|uniref:Acyltransferase n=1 Tax=Clostridium hominis TaxID=2763036 RepID=A0ABR7DFR7_9CLOT|nr:acyltransferase [Clostridium hominis]MBC5630265.1 acyltransferase [Clostridium hominis]
MIKRIFSFIRARVRKRILEEIWLEDYVKRGMKIGENCSIQPRCIFDYSHCNLITIGDNVTIAPQAYLLAHDASTKRDLGYTKVGQVIIEDNVFVGARALIMPGVTVGKNSIVAADSVVTKDVPPNSIVAGNPARVIETKIKYIEKNRELLELLPKFSWDYSNGSGKLTEDMKIEMKEKLKDSMGYMV